MNYLKIKSILTSDGMAIKVEVLQKLEPVQGTYGMEYPYDVKVNDKQLFRWNASQTQNERIEAIGVPVFWVKRWDKGIKCGFNFFEEGDINVQPQNLPKAIEISKIATTMENQQEVTQERILRGMIFNQACALLAHKDHKNIIADIKFLTEKLYTEMKPWLTNSEETHVKAKEESTGDVVKDHSLPF